MGLRDLAASRYLHVGVAYLLGRMGLMDLGVTNLWRQNGVKGLSYQKGPGCGQNGVIKLSCQKGPG